MSGFGAWREEPMIEIYAVIIHMIWLAVDQMHFLLPLDYKKECGVEEDKYMPLLHPTSPF